MPVLNIVLFTVIIYSKGTLFYCQFSSLAALVAKTPNLQTIPFAWHIMHSGEYEKAVKAKGDMKKFDFIHMIQVL